MMPRHNELFGGGRLLLLIAWNAMEFRGVEAWVVSEAIPGVDGGPISSGEK